MKAEHASAVVLAAGSSSRFGSAKLLAPLRGTSVLQHVLDAVAGVGFGEVVVVLGVSSSEIEAGTHWRRERRLCNLDSADGLSRSLRLGMGAVSSGSDAAMILLGDQPLVSPEVMRRLLDELVVGGRPVILPLYSAGGGANPVLIDRVAWHIADEATGDRGLGPVIRNHSELVAEIAVEGYNPDIDTPADLAALEQAGPGGGGSAATLGSG